MLRRILISGTIFKPIGGCLNGRPMSSSWRLFTSWTTCEQRFHQLPPYSSPSPGVYAFTTPTITRTQSHNHIRALSDERSSEQPTPEQLLAKLKEIEANISKQLERGLDRPNTLSQVLADKAIDVAVDLPPPFGRNVQGWKLKRAVKKRIGLSQQDVMLLEPVRENPNGEKEDGELTRKKGS